MRNQCLWLLLCFVPLLDSAKILGVFHIPSKSQHILGKSLLKELAQRGHEVTMLSPFIQKSTEQYYRNIEITGMTKNETGIKDILSNAKFTFFKKMLHIKRYLLKFNEIILNNTNVTNLIISGEKFDLIIQSWASSEALLGLAHVFQAHSIVFTIGSSSLLTNGINPSSYTYISNPLFHLPNNMTFLERGANTFINTVQEFLHYTLIYPEQERMLKKYFPTAPSLITLLLNVSVVLLNSHHNVQSPQPLVPSMVEIGGFHINSETLPIDLCKFLDSANEGAILVNLEYADAKDKLETIVETFRKLPVKVLWRHKNPNITKPSNVLIKKWFPQKDVLAHRNIKAFVTHGGLLSTTEAIYNGVPMIGIPVFGDQEDNIIDAVNKGFAIKIDFHDLTEVALTTAVNEVLHNPRFHTTVEEFSILVRDQPIKPMDKAIYWIEYVLNHKGAHHLKTSALQLQWYQLLDLIAFLIIVVTVVITFIYFVVICVCISSTDNYDDEETVDSHDEELNKKKEL